MDLYELTSGWQLKERDTSHVLAQDFASSEGWLPATVPGTVHQALMAAGHIPDPFVGLNELAVQWVGERDWLYRCRFDLPFDGSGSVDLCFDGLDTFATVWLNGQQVLVSDNMFVPARVEVGSLLRPGGNELQILFESAWRRGKEREAEHGVMHVWNGDPSRVYVRKAQYHYGWDWGPTLITAGPWRSVRLEVYHARIADLHCAGTVAPDLQSASLAVTVDVEGAAGAIALALIDPQGAVVDQVQAPVTANQAQHRFQMETPQLWWPNGQGAQALYQVTATLLSEETVLDRQDVRVGLRRLRLLQEPLANEPGTSFVFEINNVALFCGGVNWIPADSFLPRITPERYGGLLQLAADANMLMVRVWGGGIYEADIFYELCDELGLLVWQDVMFGCGLYPAYPEFQASVRAEAEAAVRRLRNHPSLALWCGNNEDYILAASLGRYDPSAEGDLTESVFPARALYEELLPEVCAALDPGTPYWPGSPFAGRNPNDGTVGDRHTWDVWHGQMAPYQKYPAFAGRFVSEFGMQAFPSEATIAAFAPPDERYVGSRTLEHHNKAEGGVRRLAVYLADTVRPPADLAGTVYATQLVQAEAMGAALRGWRRRFGGAGRQEVAGALIWQLNDCWPVISWAIVDYALRPKAAYYTVKRELAPLVIGLAAGPDGAAIWAVNGRQDPVEADLLLQAWTLDGVLKSEVQRPAMLPPNQATELGLFEITAQEPLVIGARLLAAGAVLSRAALWPEPLKYLSLTFPELVVAQDGEHLRLRVSRPAKGVWLAAEDGVRWSDNFLDLLPGDEQIIVAHGLGNGAVQARWLV